MSSRRDWFDTDFYVALGIDPADPEVAVTRAYRRLARQFHPDTNPGDVGAEERFKAAAAAYDVVGDPLKRAQYDELRRLGPYGRAGGILGAGGPVVADLHAEVHLAVGDAARGVTAAVLVSHHGRCIAYAAPDARPVTCGDCEGRGIQEHREGFFSRSRLCVACRGSGRLIIRPCPHCAAAGVECRWQEVKVPIAPGAVDGQRIRFPNRGGPVSADGPARDLYVTVRVGSPEAPTVRSPRWR